MKTPTIRDLRSLLIALKGDIDDDYRADDDCDHPSMCVTIGASTDGSWDYQTGDNSYSGGAYGHKHWAVVTLDRRSNCTELARDIQGQLLDSFWQSAPTLKPGYAYTSTRRNPREPETVMVADSDCPNAEWVGECVIDDRDFNVFKNGNRFYFQLVSF